MGGESKVNESTGKKKVQRQGMGAAYRVMGRQIFVAER